MKRIRHIYAHMLNQLCSHNTRRLRLWPAAKRTAVPIVAKRKLILVSAMLGTALMSVIYLGIRPSRASSGKDVKSPSFANPTSTVFINEILYDITGTDAGEFVEVAAPAGTNMANYSIVLYNGANGLSYDTDALSGTTTNQQGGYGTVSISYLSNGIQNGAPDGIALINTSTNTVIQFLCYEGTFTAGDGLASGMTCTNIGVSQDGTNAAGTSLQLQGSGTTYGNFTWNATSIPHTQNMPNTGQTFTGGIGLSINDVSLNEGNAGTTSFTFTVSLSAPAGPGGVTFDIATADGTAQDDNPVTEDNDYVAKSLTAQTIPAGSSTYSFTVLVNGDTTPETNETFFVNVTNVTGATSTDGQGQGTIVNDDAAPNLTINDVTLNEGNAGTTTFTFTVSLSAPAGAGGVTFDIATADGTAQDDNPVTEDNDYVAKSLTAQTIPAGSSTYSFTVLVNGDTTPEADETFFVNVTNATNAIVTDGQGQGTIVNDDITKIHDVQGNGAATPIPGSTVTVEGIVTANFQGTNKLQGFFLQEEDADFDADPATSEGIFIFCSSCPTPVAEGQRVKATGVVSEFNNMTEITASTAGSVVVTNAGNNLAQVTPSPIDLPIVGVVNDFYEAREGMKVTFVDTLTVSEYFELGRFGQIILYEGGRPRQFTEANAPSVAGNAAQADNLSRRQVILDDDNNAQEAYLTTSSPPGPPDGLQSVYYPHANGGLSVGTQGTDFFRGGDLVNGLTGVLHWSFPGFGADTWRIRPTAANPATFTVANPRPATPPNVGGAIKVAGMNLLNYFTTIDTTASNSSGPCGPSGTLDCRGADSVAELNRQRERASIVICTLNADVYGFAELENTTPSASITDLLGAVNARCGGAHPYTFVNTGGTLGTDAIRVQQIYRTGIVSPVGSPLSDLDPVHNRPPTAQTFDVVDATNPAFGQRFTVIVNHFKSKGCPGTGSDADIGDGQGCFNGTRIAQAMRLLAWINGTVLPAAGDPDVILLGDFNAYAKEDPITTLVAGGFNDLETTFHGANAYSYLFDGQLGHLDYGFASASLLPQITGADAWHINADEVDLFDYNDEVRDSPGEATFEEKPDGSALAPPRVVFQPASPYRASDHDPVIVGLFQIADLSITKTDSPDPVTAGNNLTYTITVTNNGPDPASNASWSDTLPAGTTFVSMPDVAGWSCTKPMVGMGGTISCSNSSFAVGSAAFTLTVAVDPSVAAGTVLSNTAMVTSTTAEGNPGNESDTVTTTVAASANLSVSKMDTPDPVTAGSNLTYTITVNNAGPSNADSVSLSDTLPAGTTFVSLAKPVDWSCSTPMAGASGTVSCSIASLVPGNAVFTLVVKVGIAVAGGTTITNIATVSSSTSDPTPGNESGVALTLVNAFPCPTSFTVNSTADTSDATPGDGMCNDGSGNCTLRAAIQEANAVAVVPCSPLTINITPTGMINLGSALPNLDHPNLTINGPGATLLSIVGNNASTVFTLNSSRTAAINNLTVTGGRDTAGKGGGINNLGTLTLTNVIVSGNTSITNGTGGISSSGTLTLLDSTVRNNTTTATDAAAGGITTTGTTTLTNSTVSGNTSASGAGGIVQSGGMLTLTNSTVSGNRTNDKGGGILVTANSKVNLFNSTITDNHANNDNTGPSGETGGGIQVLVGTVTLQNTIVAGNFLGSGTTTDDDIRGIVTANFSFIGNTSGATITGGNNLSGNPLLGALANYGGPTQTHALLPGSPAINAGTSSGAPATDQRGFARVGTVDIGAFESQGFTLAVTGGTNQSTAINTNFANPLRVNVTANNVNEPVNGGLVTFTPPGSGASASLVGSPATITSGMATSGTVTANSTAGTYNVAASANGASPVNFMLTNLAPPAISPQAGVARQQGSSSSNSQIASASDVEDVKNTLQVQISSDGMTFSNSAMLNNVTVTLTDSNAGAAGTNPNATGQVFADVIAACSASSANFTLKVTDSNGQTGTATLMVTVNANTLPTLSYANQSVALGGSINVSPTTASDNGSITGYSIVSVVPPLNVAPTVNSSGVVMITSANPPGNHTITVRATDNCNVTNEANFTLNVTALAGNLLSGSISDPLVCTGPGNAVAGTIQLNNPAGFAQTFMLTTNFSNYVGVPGSCVLTGAVAGATCAVSSGGLTASGSIPANTILTVQYQAQVANVPNGAVLTAINAATLGGAPVSPNPLVFTATVNCPAVGPGLLATDVAEVSDQKAGSVLFYNLYSSSIAAPNAQNTRISITNTHPQLPIAVHLFFVDGATCSIADSVVCLTANQTASFLASDIDPGTTGYIVAVASNLVTGCPVDFNYLIGDVYVKLSSGHAANLAAEGFAAIAGGLPACNGLSVTALLSFDGASYNRAPRVLAASNVPSRADGNDTVIVLNRFGGSLAAGAATLGALFGILYDDAENPLSFTFTAGVCQFRSSLSSNFPRVAPRFEQFIPAGRSGWAKFYSQSDVALLGAQLNFNANAGAAANAFNQGHNLHKLTLTSAAVLTIPVFPPNC